MINFEVLPLFFISILVLIITPGPDMLLITSYSSARGAWAGASIAIGVFIAGLIQTGAVAMGLGQIMQLMPGVAFAVKLIGAVYLGYLGMKMLHAWYLKGAELDTTTRSQPSLISKSALVKQGMLNNLLNPKALVFFSLFLPQFTHPNASISGQILVFGLLLSVTGLIINLFFALSSAQISHWITARFNMRRVARHADALLGLVFIGLAMRLMQNRNL